MMDYHVQEAINMALRNYFDNAKYADPYSHPFAKLLADIDQIRMNVSTLFLNSNGMNGKYSAYKSPKITMNAYDVSYILPPDDNNSINMVVCGDKLTLLFDTKEAAQKEFDAINAKLLTLN